jgi:hypothetical protein
MNWLPIYNLARRIKRSVWRRRFQGSTPYWEERYARGGTSGDGSYDELAKFKADFINKFVRENRIGSIIEFGSGDGNQLELAEYSSYIGFDVSPTAVQFCKQRFSGDAAKEFRLADDFRGEKAELCLSLDVLYHLVEDEVFDDYMRRLFDTATRFVIIYSSDTDDQTNNALHVRHRKFSAWVAMHLSNWSLMQHEKNAYPFDPATGQGSWAEFFVYRITGA